MPAATTARADAGATHDGFSLDDPTLHAIQFLQRAPGELTTEPVNPSTSPPGAHFFFALQGFGLQLRMVLACVMMALALGIAFH